MTGRPISPRRLGLELALFATIGGLAVAQWSRLVVDPPAAGLIATLAIASAIGTLLGLVSIGRLARSRALALAIVVLGLGAAVAAVGMPARLLAPPNWPELIDLIGLGLAGIEDTDLPYAGGDRWIRLTLLLLAPLLLCTGAALGFWPARRRGALRVLGLAAVITLYGFAVTLDSPRAELFWGLVLTVLAAAWLWVDRLEGRRAAVAIAVATVAGVCALPAAAALDRDRPLWDYEGWDWFGGDRSVTFDWSHDYGPLDWQREGTTMLEVQSIRPLYWKATVLDRFDGFTWQRAENGDLLSEGEIAARMRTPGARLAETRPDWLTEVSFRVEALSSELVVGAGTPQDWQGVDALASRDGTLLKRGEPLEAATSTRSSPTLRDRAPPSCGACPRTTRRRSSPDRCWSGCRCRVSCHRAAVATTPTPMALWGHRDPAADAALCGIAVRGYV